MEIIKREVGTDSCTRGRVLGRCKACCWNTQSARLVTLGDDAFKVAAPTLWNKLPTHTRNSKSLNSFKNLLKTHLFKLSFLD